MVEQMSAIYKMAKSIYYKEERLKQSKGTKCLVCGFDFEKTYGELGKGFIHIHHISPISNRDGRYEIEVENELFPVYPNFYAMLNRRKDSILSIEELKLIM